MNKEPFLQVSKRRNKAGWQERLLIRFIALILALIVCGAVIVALVKMNPVDVYKAIWDGAMGSERRLWQTIRDTMVLLCISIGLAPAFKMKFWNIGAEGQFYMGAFGAASMAFMCPDLPPILLLPLMCVAGFICGGLWALIPAVIKAKFGASETLVTLMMNYIAIAFISYLQYGPWKDPAALGAAKVPNFSENAVLPDVFGIHAGWIIMLVLVIIMTILLRYTKLGYQIDVIGESETTAKYAGMNTVKILVIAVLISGGLCGMAGFMQSSAVEKSITDSMSAGLGFTAVITAWLAKLKPPVIVVASFMFSILLQSGSSLQVMKIPSSITEIMQGVIIFFVLACEFFINYKISFRKHTAVKEAE